MVQKDHVNVTVAHFNRRGRISDTSIQLQRQSRITRLVDDATRFLHVAVNQKIRDDELRTALSRWIREGIVIDGVT